MVYVILTYEESVGSLLGAFPFLMELLAELDRDMAWKESCAYKKIENTKLICMDNEPALQA